MPTSNSEAAEQFDNLAQQRYADLMGMWLFLATELLLFGGLFAGFIIFRVEYPQVFAEAAGHLDLTLGAINTVILLTSGLSMALAEQAVIGERRRLALGLITATLILAVIFLLIKGYEWHHEYSEQLMPVLGLPFEYSGDEPRVARLFFNFYYSMTGLHAVHMLAGIGLLAVMLILVGRWRDAGRQARQVQIMGLYWAFVDVVWVFVFTLLYLLRT